MTDDIQMQSKHHSAKDDKDRAKAQEQGILELQVESILFFWGVKAHIRPENAMLPANRCGCPYVQNLVPWRMSKVKWVYIALPDAYFKSLGLSSPWT